MTRQETAAILKILKIAYPGFYSKLPPGEMNDWLSLWSTVFAEEDAQIVTYAVKDLIQSHTGFPPEIADVRTKITELVRTATGEPSDEEYWRILIRALGNGVWGAEDEFRTLPTELQTYCGSPSWLRDHARMDIETLNSVVHGQFLKQFPAIKRAQREREAMGPELLGIINKVFGRIPDGEYVPLDAGRVNDRRNELISRLEAGK